MVQVMTPPKLIISSVGSPMHDLPSVAAREGRGKARIIAIYHTINTAMTIFTSIRMEYMFLPCLPWNVICCVPGAISVVFVMTDLNESERARYV
jgi:hypothetical protein